MTLKKINKGSQVGHTKENILLYFETLIFLRMILSIFNYILRFASFFQAYDESWKTSAPVEAHWGLYYEGSRTPKFDFDISSYSKLFLFGLNLMYGSSKLNIFVYFLMHSAVLIKKILLLLLVFL